MPKVLKMQPEKDKRELLPVFQFGVTMLHGGVTNFRTQLTYCVFQEVGSDFDRRLAGHPAQLRRPSIVF